MTFIISPPKPDEYPAHYAGYMSLVPAGNIMDILEAQREEALRQFATIPEESGTLRYEPGKWSVNDVILHMIDAERITITRALRISRGDKTPMPGWEQDDYAALAGGDGRETTELAEEFDVVRQSAIALYKSFDPEAVVRKGTANGHEVTVSALVYWTAGHVAHHLKVLRERYPLAWR